MFRATRITAALLVGAAVASTGAAPARPAAATAHAIAFRDLSGRAWTQAEIAAHPATVFFFISSDCPVSNTYSSRIEALAGAWQRDGVAAFAVYPDPAETLAAVRAHASAHGLTLPLVHAGGGALARLLHATTTPEAIVVDRTGAVRYSGRIDDNAILTRVTTHEVADAVAAVLAGRPVAVPHAPSFGCAIRVAANTSAALPGVPTYAGKVAAILNAKCVECHRAGQVAPFPLQTFREAGPWAQTIKQYTASGAMPPWKPAPGYGHFRLASLRTLTASEKQTIARWADGGAPEGARGHAPRPPSYASGWALGAPDVVVQPSAPYHLAADGEDVYRNFVVDPHLDRDAWIVGAEVRPGNRAVVHHVIVFIDGARVSPALEARTHDGQPGYVSFGGPGFLPGGMLAGWAPGNDPGRTPEGVGILVPKHALLVIQVHYHKDGKPETDLTKIGLHFARHRIEQRLWLPMVLNFTFRIRPGARDYPVECSTVIRQDSHAIFVTPHMHLLGRDMKVWATLPDGRDVPLVWIRNWDFNWQMNYAFAQPIALPRGTVVHLVAHYDNSAANTRNPNRRSPVPVTWGEQTTDEMCIAFLGLTHDAERLNADPGPPPSSIASRR